MPVNCLRPCVGGKGGVLAIRVARGVAEHIIKYPGSISLQVQGAADAEAAATALRLALEEIETLGRDFLSLDGDPLTPNSIGGVAMVPGGPFIPSINAPMVPEPELARIPDIVARHLREAGVRDAVIALPPKSGPLDDIEHAARAVMLRLYPPRRTDSLKPPPLPGEWIEVAWRWLADHLVDDVVNVRASLVQFPVLAQDLADFARRYPEDGASIMVNGDLGSRAWGVHLNVNLVLAFGGPQASDDELVAMAEELIAIARRLAPELDLAFIDIAERFGPFSTLSHGTSWYSSGGESPSFVEWVCDQLCFDGFPYQVLGPGHLARLAAASPDGSPPAKLRPLEAGRAELAVGELTSWLPGNPERPRVLEEARRLLAPCLLRRGESKPLRDERQRASRRTVSGDRPSARQHRPGP